MKNKPSEAVPDHDCPLKALRLEAIATLQAMLAHKDPKVRLRAAQIALAATREKKSGVGSAGVPDAAEAAEAALNRRDAGSGGE